jgi:hypothetical protein
VGDPGEAGDLRDFAAALADAESRAVAARYRRSRELPP